MTEPGHEARDPDHIIADPGDPPVYDPDDDDWLESFGARVLRPDEAVPAFDGGRVGSTIYQRDALLVYSMDLADEDLVDFLRNALGRLRLTFDLPAPVPSGLDPDLVPLWNAASVRPPYGIPRTVTLRFDPAFDPVLPIDAWTALQTVRRRATQQPDDNDPPKFVPFSLRISLNHILQGTITSARDEDITGHPGGVEGHGDGEGAVGNVDRGGRRPVAMVSAEPVRTFPPHRRPVFALFDTVIGTNPWLRLRSDVTAAGQWTINDQLMQGVALSYVPPSGRRYYHPLRGTVRSHSGHADFIAGIVRQLAPDAVVAPIPVMRNNGGVAESDLTAALGLLLNRISPAGAPDNNPATFVDGVILSLGYYAEERPRPEDPLLRVLNDLAALGVAVFCSAGNDATARPCYPAACADLPSPTHWTADLRVARVAAINPNGTAAIFSNHPRDDPNLNWPTIWARGVDLVSTLPTNLVGSGSPRLRLTALGQRQSLAPDDFSSGLATWRGTSFATAVAAGRFAARLLAAQGQRVVAAQTDPNLDPELSVRRVDAIARVRNLIR
jgi:hypothetical protein